MNTAEKRPRARDVGLVIGALPPGPLDALTDVPGVCVGHVGLIRGSGPLRVGQGPVRTGVTAILPHAGDLYRDKVPGAVHVINGFGKAVGLAQVAELGRIETPIVLTSTLSVWRAADALVDHAAARRPGLGSVNPVVGECNDGYLNDVLGRHVTREHVLKAVETASAEDVQEGNVGAGVGMSGFGWKGGIGTSSRVVEADWGRCTVGMLVLTNTGAAADLRFDGIPIGRHLQPGPPRSLDGSAPGAPSGTGSIMLVLGTDAPVSGRQLGRLARRVSFGLARVGGIASHGSGDFCIAFCTRRTAASDFRVPEEQLSLLFRAVIDATEEAIINSVLRAETLTGRDGHVRQGIPVDRVRELVQRYRAAE